MDFIIYACMFLVVFLLFSIDNKLSKLNATNKQIVEILNKSKDKK